jgi:hypothetical protein
MELPVQFDLIGLALAGIVPAHVDEECLETELAQELNVYIGHDLLIRFLARYEPQRAHHARLA